jgi:hypothetical protein
MEGSLGDYSPNRDFGLLFEKPVSKSAIVHDPALVIWWAFIIWLLVVAFKEPKPTNSKWPTTGTTEVFARRFS